MKIRSLRLENFRKFTSPIVLSGFTEGVNVLAESNEFGKSTLLAAIRGVLFERHVSRAASVTQMQHWANKTSPTIALEFELPDGLHRIEKRFLHREPYARLTLPNGTVHHGEAAEEHLQGILGFTQAGKSGSKPENVGMWAALWVTQRDSVDQPGLTESARQTIHGCLEQEVGALAGGNRGKRLVVSVRTELAKIRDGNRKPAGRYKEAVQDLAAARQSLEGLQRRQQSLLEDIAQLDLLKRKLSDTAAGEEENRTSVLLAEASQKRETARGFEEKERTALSNLKLHEERVASARKEAEERRQQDAQLLNVAARVEKLTAEEAAARVDLLRAEEFLTTQRDLVRSATEKHDHAVGTVREAKTILDLATIASGLQAFRDRKTLAETSQSRINTLIAQLSSLPITEPDLLRLRDLDKKLGNTLAVLEAQATQITFNLLPSASSLVHLDGNAIPTTPVSLVHDAVISIEGMGDILIRPGIRDRETLLAQRDQQTSELRQALQTVSATTLAHAEERLDTRRLCETELKQARQELANHTPADTTQKLGPGLEALRNHIAVLETRLSVGMSAAGLASLPHHAEAQAALNQAEADEKESSSAVSIARAPLPDLEHRQIDAVRAHSRIESEHKSAVGEETRLLADRNLRLQQESGEALAERLTSSNAALLAQQSLLDVLASERPAETVATLDSRIVRYQGALHAYAREREADKIRLAVLVSRIEREEGVGIAEQVAAAEHTVDSFDRESIRYQQEIKVLELLLDSLETAERSARERYLAPVVQRITPYLQTLFPGAAIYCDEHFQITGIIRELQQSEDFPGLSVGTQEQIAVLTRLALAELLLERGKPATVILDDALVYSDPERMERMFDLLTHAATRTQILIFTCRGELFTRLGGNRLRLTVC
jgi:energy-coupling factor transporter ATP-binding protein EcfA2